MLNRSSEEEKTAFEADNANVRVHVYTHLLLLRIECFCCETAAVCHDACMRAYCKSRCEAL
jgi:hypothetical protein